MKFEALRKKYKKFVYESYSHRISRNNLEIFFDFRIEPGISFRPKIVIENSGKVNVSGKVLNNLVFHLGLIEMLSYWKATCSKTIEIKCGRLSALQARWWKDLILNGMGEFFYVNKINPKIADSLEIVSKESAEFEVFKKNLSEKVLLPIGGGKDSIVSLELLKDSFDVSCFSLNPNKTIERVMKTGGCGSPVIVRRTIDSKLLELNRKGFLNGHTPFSAYLAFLTVLTGVIFNKKYIAVSNERSSDEGNVEYLSRIINHQYSKTLDFENRFRRYSGKYLAENIEYFSLLRPLYEIQIAQIFSKHFKKYGKAFLSCNRAYATESGLKKQTGEWCCRCPKCLFIFVILYPFIETRKLVDVFGRNLLDDRELVGLMDELVGEKRFKPFECVGTHEESLAAFYLSLKKDEELPYLLRYFERRILNKHPGLEKKAREIMEAWNGKNNLSSEFKKLFH